MHAHSVFIIELMPWNENGTVYVNHPVDTKWDGRCTHTHPSAISANYAMFNVLCLDAHSSSEPW